MNFIKRLFSNRAKTDECFVPAETYQQRLEKTKAEIAERQAEQAEKNEAALVDKYQWLNAKLASGRVLEVKRSWIHFMSGNGMEFFVTDDSLQLLFDLIESGDRKVVKLRAWDQLGGPANTVRVRSEALCFVSEYTNSRWFIVDDQMISVPGEEQERLLETFQTMESGK